jgi:hypothetical protein
MGKFKQYLLKEEIGLADLGSRVDKVFNSQWLGNAINGAFVTNDYNGVETSPTLGFAGVDTKMPSTDLTIPSIQKQGRITTLLLKNNPIYVRLSDGTEAHFSYDEYKRIQGEPALGKVMTITFQRHPSDSTKSHSKIDRAIVND